MKTIGLIGGLSWESSLQYYRIINEQVKQKLGGLHSAQCVMYSVDFDEIEKLQSCGDWYKATQVMIDAAHKLEKAGADFVLICSNTMHKTADSVERHSHIPLLHIADATMTKIKSAGLKKVGLLGTKFTMEEDFYTARLARYGLEVLIPDAPERQLLHDVIYHELCLGVINPLSKQQFITIIKNLVQQGAEAVILGCTEIPLLVQQNDSDVLLFDTTTIHAQAAVAYALNDPK